jgi:hypothetical protein
MGHEAHCEVRVDGQTAWAKALLEQKDLILRGPLRLSVPFAHITEATASDGWLRIRFDGRSAEIGLGSAAEKWAQRITNASRLTKLGIKPGMRILVLGEVDAAFVEELRAAGATILRRASNAAADVIFFAVDRKESLDELRALASKIVPSGAVWTLRQKGQRTVTEADTMAAGKRAGLVDVKVVSFSETLTAEKFVIPVAKRPATAAAAKRSKAPAAAKRPSAAATQARQARAGGHTRLRQTPRTA